MSIIIGATPAPMSTSVSCILTLIDFIRIITGDLGPKGGDYETTF